MSRLADSVKVAPPTFADNFTRAASQVGQPSKYMSIATQNGAAYGIGSALADIGAQMLENKAADERAAQMAHISRLDQQADLSMQKIYLEHQNDPQAFQYHAQEAFKDFAADEDPKIRKMLFEQLDSKIIEYSGRAALTQYQETLKADDDALSLKQDELRLKALQMARNSQPLVKDGKIVTDGESPVFAYEAAKEQYLSVLGSRRLLSDYDKSIASKQFDQDIEVEKFKGSVDLIVEADGLDAAEAYINAYENDLFNPSKLDAIKAAGNARLQDERMAQRQKKKEQEAALKQQAEIELNDHLQKLRMGEVGLEQSQEMIASGKFNKKQIEQIIKLNEQNIVLNNALANEMPLDKTEDKDAANMGYDRLIYQNAETASPQELNSKVIAFSSKIGYLPSKAVSAAKKMLKSANPDYQAVGVDFYIKAQNASKGALNLTGQRQFSEQDRAFIDVFNLHYSLNGDAAESSQLALSATDPANQALREARADEFKKADFNRITFDDFAEGIDAWNQWEGERSLDWSDEFMANHEEQLNDLFESHYLRTGDEDIARDYAFSEMNKVYGVSGVTGDNVIMSHPPEKYYNMPVDAMKDQLLSEVKEGMNWEATTKLASGLSKTNAEPEVRIISDTVTESDAKKGKPPTYLVVVDDEFFTDDEGKFLRWSPDYKKYYQGIQAQENTEYNSEKARLDNKNPLLDMGG